MRLEDWINILLSKGKMAFSLSELKEKLPGYSRVAIKRALSRLSQKGIILSIHKGYYLIIPPHYTSKGSLPPGIFIDGLMSYLEKPYYVGLLSAAAIHGAAHQQPQEFYVITTLPPLKPTQKKNIKINYITKKELPEKYIVRKKMETGYLKVSSPELTAIDLLRYEKRAGGLNRIGTVLNELVEVFDKKKINGEFIGLASASSIQRLGYILENIIEAREYADKLFNESKKAGVKFNRIGLAGNERTKGFSSNNRWNIVVNTNIEIDE